MNLYLTDTVPNPNSQWTISQGYPGSRPRGGDIRIFNLGSVEANHVEIAFQTVGYEDDDGNPNNGYVAGPESDSNPNGVGEMTKSIMINTMDYTAGTTTINLIWNTYDPSLRKYIPHYDSRVIDWNQNSMIDLDDLSHITIDNLPAPPALDSDRPDGDYTQLDMELSFYDNHNLQNDFQGDVIDMTVEVTLNQDASQ